jgi:hypothetical protein
MPIVYLVNSLVYSLLEGFTYRVLPKFTTFNEGKYTQVQEFMVLKIDTVLHIRNTLISDDLNSVLNTAHIL